MVKDRDSCSGLKIIYDGSQDFESSNLIMYFKAKISSLTISNNLIVCRDAFSRFDRT